MKNQYTAAVIGLGQIGMLYDMDLDASCVLTHTRAYSLHPGFVLIGGVDSNKKNRQIFSEKYTVSAYSTVADLLSALRPDVVSISVPTSLHYRVFTEVMEYPPKAILCEKPMTGSSTEAKQMWEIANSANTSLFVNYMRRFEPGVLALKKQIECEAFGGIEKIIVKYTQSFMHSGSHFIDLLKFLLGDLGELKRLENGIIMTYSNKIELFFIPINVSEYHLYELEFISEKGVLRYSNAGSDIRFHKKMNHPYFPETNGIDQQGQALENDFYRFQWHVMNAIYNALTSGDNSSSNVSDTIEVLELMERVNE